MNNNMAPNMNNNMALVPNLLLDGTLNWYLVHCKVQREKLVLENKKGMY